MGQKDSKPKVERAKSVGSLSQKPAAGPKLESKQTKVETKDGSTYMAAGIGGGRRATTKDISTLPPDNATRAEELNRFLAEFAPEYPKKVLTLITEYAEQADGKCVHSVRMGERVNCMAALPDGRIACGLFDVSHVVEFINPETGEVSEDRLLEERSSHVLCLAPLPQNRLATVNIRTILIWDLSTRKVVGQFDDEADSFVRCAIALRDGRLATASSMKTIKIWDLSTRKPDINITKLEDEVLSMLELPDGRIASCSSDKLVRIWETKTGTCTQQLKAHTGTIYSLTLLPSGYLVSASGDNTYMVWNLETSKRVKTVLTYKSETLAVLRDGRLASTHDSAIKLWDAVTGQNEATWDEHASEVRVLLALPNGMLASTSGDPVVKLWK